MRGWRALPTAWIHFFVVELFHVYLAVFAWFKLVNKINSRCALSAYFEGPAAIDHYFSTLFFLGSVSETTIRMRSVSDDFFLSTAQRAEPEQERIFFNGSTLVLPGTFIDPNGSNMPWLLLAWVLPAGAAALLFYTVLIFVAHGFWSFESAAYLHFTWHLPRRSFYRWCVGVMALAPTVLPILWLVQIALYNGITGQLPVLQASAVSIFMLLLALDMLAFPTVPVHDWGQSDDFLRLTFRRHFLQLFLGRNSSFGMKLVDALWAASHGDWSRLKRYLDDPEQLVVVVAICRQAQEVEAEAKQLIDAEGSTETEDE